MFETEMSNINNTNIIGRLPRLIFVDAHTSQNGEGSINNPFKNFDAINEMNLLPEDRIYLKRGSVWNQQLIINCCGNSSGYIEVGAYGDAAMPRPHIRLNGDITERCIRINNASYFKISSIEVSNAGAGIVFFYDHSYHNEWVYVDDIIAHEFYGIYDARGEFGSNPAWQSYSTYDLDRVGFSYGIGFTGREDTENNQTRVLSYIRLTNCEIYKSGAGIALDWCDHTNADHTMAGPNKFYDVVCDNLYLHDNDVPEVSLTSMFMQCCTNAIIRNTIIDRGCYHAPWGSAAIHLQYTRNVIFQNVTIKNIPLSTCNDNGGIDFETDNEDTVIDSCRFENIPGAGVMFLANNGCHLEHPESRNVIIKNSQFINCGYGDKYRFMNVPAFAVCVMLWPGGNRPTGEIHHNTYKLGVSIETGAVVPFFGGDGDLTGMDVHDNAEVT